MSSFIPKQNKKDPITIRMKEEMLQKLSYVADYEGRSVNSQVLALIRDSIKDFEERNGKIDGEISPCDNVKPRRK